MARWSASAASGSPCVTKVRFGGFRQGESFFYAQLQFPRSYPVKEIAGAFEQLDQVSVHLGPPF